MTLSSLPRIIAVAAKEVRQLMRDRLTLGMVIGVPTLQILLFGFAINTDIRHLPAGVVDAAHTQLSTTLIARLAATQVVDFVYVGTGPADLGDALRRGDISVAVVIPYDFEQRLRRRSTPAAQILVDASDPIILAAARQLAQTPIHIRDGNTLGQAPNRIAVAALYNPERRSAVNIVPGLIGVILTLTMVLFTAVAIVRERERGNLEFLITTPVKPWELMLAKILPYIGIGLIQVTLVLALGVTIFSVPIRGTVLDVYLAALIFVAASLALGLLLSTLAKTQFQAMQLTIFIFLPSIFLSGFMFPFDGMPRLAQQLGEILPLTHFVRLSRAIVLRGASLGEMSADAWNMAIFALIALLLAAIRFRKRLD